MQDKTLVCRECGAEFVFTGSEQDFYAEKGFQNEPGRCPSCRAVRRNGGMRGADRPMYDAICASCGTECRVPFQPRNDKPVFCSTCFAAQRSGM